jgi:ABC-type Na+ efflux pump permease subunit
MAGEIVSALKIARVELKKSRKKYSKSSFLMLILVAVLSFSILFFAITSGIKSDSYLYEVSGTVVDDYRFVYSERQPDLVIYKAPGGYQVVVSGSDKSLAAVDELRKIIRDDYEARLYSRYGIEAFPVFVKANFLERDLQSGIQPTLPTNLSSISEIGNKIEKSEIDLPEPEKKNEALRIVKESFESRISLKEKLDYTTPEDFSPQSLLKKMFLAFFFIIPSYFMIQLFSASMLEDKATRRLDVLLSSPVNPSTVIAGKMIPYLVFSVILVLSVSLVLGESPLALVYVFPFILFAFSLQTYIVLISRSYKEMTFLIMVTSFLITAYLFIPAIFSGTVPVSKVSPITNMLVFFESGKFSLEDYLLSTSQFYLLFLVLMFTSVKMMTPEIMHSTAGIGEKILSSLERWIKTPLKCFIASILSIPFVFIAEFMLISVIFTMPFQYSIPVFIMFIAIVEELFKTSIVLAYYHNSKKSILKASFLTATGFFVGEKILALIEIGRTYTELLLAGYLLLPLFLHILTIVIFTFMLKRGYSIAYISAVTVHFVYDYAVILMLGYGGI